MLRERKIRILHVVPMLSNGGIERVMFDYISNGELNEFDFFFASHECEGVVFDELVNVGIDIFSLPSLRNPIEYYKILSRVITKIEPDIVHIHQGHLSVPALLMTYLFGVKTRIVHMHWVLRSMSLFTKVLHGVLGYLTVKLSTQVFACSHEALTSLGSKSLTKIKNAKVVYNAIDFSRYKFSSETREFLNQKFDLDGKLLGSMIARFTPEKNHFFALDVVSEMVALKPNLVFWFIGDGDLLHQIKSLVQIRGLNDNVKFLGNRSDVDVLLSRIDFIILPSYHEGLGRVLIEAQIMGVNSYASTKVPSEVKLGNNLHFFDLKSGPKFWANEIIGDLEKNRTGNILEPDYINYNMEFAAKKLACYYKILLDERN